MRSTAESCRPPVVNIPTEAFQQLCRLFGHRSGDILEIGDAPFRAVSNQRSSPLKRRCSLRTAPSLARCRHPALCFAPLQLMEGHPFHSPTANSKFLMGQPPRPTRVPVGDGACADFAPARLASLDARSSRLSHSRRERGASVGSLARSLRCFLRSDTRSTAESRRLPRQHPNRSRG